MVKKDKIDFDLNFLDENTKEKPKHPPRVAGADFSSKDPNRDYYKDGKGNKPELSGGMSDSVKKWLWGIGIVVAISIISSLGNTGSSTSSTSNNSNDMVRNGNYMCSSYNSQQADNLGPTSSEKSSLDSLASSIELKESILLSEKTDIESEYVNDYDQNSIDIHNQKIDNFNYKLQKYRSDLKSYESQRQTYNAKIEAYNSYLITHCTKN